MYAPQNNVVRTPRNYAPQNNIVRTPRFQGAMGPHGAGPGHPGAGNKLYVKPSHK